MVTIFDLNVKDKIISLSNKSRISKTPAVLDFRGRGGGVHTVQTVGKGTRFVAVITVCDETDTPDLARRER